MELYVGMDVSLSLRWRQAHLCRPLGEEPLETRPYTHWALSRASLASGVATLAYEVRF